MQTTVETEMTRQAWSYWHNHRVKPKMTWLEVRKLAEHTTQKLRQYGRDYQEIDFIALLDPNLDYYENTDEIDIALHMRGYNLDDGFEGVGAGTGKLRIKLQALRMKNRRQFLRIQKLKLRNQRLRELMKRRKKKRKRKPQ